MKQIPNVKIQHMTVGMVYLKGMPGVRMSKRGVSIDLFMGDDYKRNKEELQQIIKFCDPGENCSEIENHASFRDGFITLTTKETRGLCKYLSKFLNQLELHQTPRKILPNETL